MAVQILHPSHTNIVLCTTILYPYTLGRGTATQKVKCAHIGTRREISTLLSVSTDAELPPQPTTARHPSNEPCCQAHWRILDVLDHPTVNEVYHTKFNFRTFGDWSYSLGSGLGPLFDTPIDRAPTSVLKPGPGGGADILG